MKIGKLLCKIGLHKWKEIFTGALLAPCGNKCQRCKLVRQFNMWGYVYGWDANDLPDHIPPPTDKDIIV